MKLADIDLLDRDRFTEGIPHEWFTFLRHEAPVYKHPEPGGRGFWVVTKHDDVVAARQEQIDQVSADEAVGAGHERGGHRAQATAGTRIVAGRGQLACASHSSACPRYPSSAVASKTAYV